MREEKKIMKWSYPINKSIREIILWCHRIPSRCTIINMQIFWLQVRHSVFRATPKGDFKCIEDTIVSGPTLHEQSRGTWFLCQQVPRWITRDSRTNSSASRIPLEREDRAFERQLGGTMLSRILSSNVTDIDTKSKITFSWTGPVVQVQVSTFKELLESLKWSKSYCEINFHKTLNYIRNDIIWIFYNFKSF